MTYQPTAQTLLYSAAGRYESFPVAATGPNNTVLTLWRSATSHAVDQGASIRGAKSTDGGVSYSLLGVVYNEGDALLESSPVGLVWNPRRNKWQALLLVKRYTAPSGGTPVEHQARLIESADGVTWTARGPVSIPRPSWVSWMYGSQLVLTDTGLTALMYGQLVGADKWSVFPLTSTDDGATWAGVQASNISVPGVHLAEPQIVQKADGSWLLAIRGEDFTIYTATAATSSVWVPSAVPVLKGYSGQPSLARSGESLLMLLRQQPGSDGVHGLWAFAESIDEGVSWAVRGTFPEKTRYMMYGGLAPLPSGDVACVYASEDDPAALYGATSVYFTRFVLLRLVADLTFEYAAPAVRVTVPVPATVERVWYDDWAGEEVVEQVRLQEPTADAGTTAVDPEIVPGVTYTYRAAGVTADPITVPEFASAYLVHPLEPDWSIPVEIGELGDESYDTNTTVTQVPYRDHVVTSASGFLSAAASEFTIRTRTLIDKKRMRRLLQGNTPLFLSTHVGLDLPEWVKPVGSIKAAPFVQMCSHNLDDASDPAQWRTWSIQYVEQPRPTATELPRRKRIRDYKQPIESINIPISET